MSASRPLQLTVALSPPCKIVYCWCSSWSSLSAFFKQLARWAAVTQPRKSEWVFHGWEGQEMLSVKSSEFDAEPPFVLDEGFTNFLCLSSFGVFNEHLFKFCCSAIVNFKLNSPPPLPHFKPMAAPRYVYCLGTHNSLIHMSMYTYINILKHY